MTRTIAAFKQAEVRAVVTKRARRIALGAALLMLTCAAFADTARWPERKAQDWYAAQRWLVGSDYIPAYAINQLEMWQADTFDPAQIDKELGWAQAIGMNTLRVFLHDQLWQQDPEGLRKRVDQFLDIADRHGIRPLLVFFDSCWEPDPKLGPQHPPIPGVHNSGWVQSPGRAGLADLANYPKLEAYVKGMIGAFRDDPRILGWDLWNEPDNGAEGDRPEAREKFAHVATLLPQVFEWARAANPSQPLTSGVWHGADWSPQASLNAIEKVQLEQSDILSFHSYDWPEVLERKITQLQGYGRPLLCTEYLARGAGSTFDTALPIARRYHVGMFNWGLVLGKTQTNFPWDSWQRPYTQNPPVVWHHDVFHPDGRPYRQAEVDQIRALTAEAQKAFDQQGKRRRKSESSDAR